MGRNPQFPHVTPSREPLFPHIPRGSIEFGSPPVQLQSIPKTTNWQRALKEAEDRLENEEEWAMFPNRETEKAVDKIISETAKKYHVPEDILRKQVLWQIKQIPEVRRRDPLTNEEIDQLLAEVTTPVPKTKPVDNLARARETKVDVGTMRVHMVLPILVYEYKGYIWGEANQELAGGNFRELYRWIENDWKYVHSRKTLRTFSNKERDFILSNKQEYF
jgi:hypothetical protein